MKRDDSALCTTYVLRHSAVRNPATGQCSYSSDTAIIGISRRNSCGSGRKLGAATASHHPRPATFARVHFLLQTMSR